MQRSEIHSCVRKCECNSGIVPNYNDDSTYSFDSLHDYMHISCCDIMLKYIRFYHYDDYVVHSTNILL